MTGVTLEQLAKTYKPEGIHAVRNLTLTVNPGELLCLLGPSGCGKTTVLKMIAGLERPTSGDVLFDGQTVLPIRAEKREAVMVFQDHLLFPYMTVGQNVAFGLKMRGVDDAEVNQRVSRMLSMVQLDGYQQRMPSQLSGGQRQRVALARALVVQPRVLLLDEPLSSLDASLRDEMRELISTLQRELSVTTVFVTHNQDEAVQLADRIALMFRGEIAQLGSARAFYDTPASPTVARFFGNRNVFSGVKRGDTVSLEIGDVAVLPRSVPDGPVHAYIRPEAVRLHIEPPSGEDQTVLEGRVDQSSYLGTFTRYLVEVADTKVEVRGTAVAPPAAEGTQVWLAVSRDRVWLTGATGNPAPPRTNLFMGSSPDSTPADDLTESKIT
jgi:ABC-type Fe3+/spermidine/putrescine transport system ATPase subunit